VQRTPLQYLNLVVTDSKGSVVSEHFYGDLFSPLEKPYCFRLEPGQKYTGPVSFMGNVSRHKQLPGRYAVQAIYQYQGWAAVSEPFSFEAPA
jgi:hypothetical protein